MYYFRVFELNKNAMKPLYSMLHTGNFVYDNEVRNSLISLGMENKEAYSLVYYDNTCDVYDAGAAEEVAEQDNGFMWGQVVWGEGDAAVVACSIAGIQDGY